jgi:tetratricopeptide (TPR) repeat protein
MTGQSADTLYERGLALYDLRKYPEAEGMLRKALVYEPGHAGAHAFLAFALLAQGHTTPAATGRVDEALREAKRAIALQPDGGLGYAALGWTSLALRRPDEALRAAAQLLRLDAQSAEGWLLSAEGWFQKREWSKALQAAEGGLQVDPRSTGLLNQRSYALIMLGRATEARTSAELALASDPESQAAYVNRGWLAVLENKPEEALGHFRAALRLDPLSEPARQGFLAALQSRNPIYRGLVRYSLWARRLTHAEALSFVIGLAWLNSLLGMAAQAFPPLYLVYLPWRLMYRLFVFFSWLADAFFYLLLRFNRRARLLLSKGEMAESNGLAFCLIAFLANLGGLILTRQAGFAVGMGVAFFMVMPAAGIFRQPERARGRRAILLALVLLLATMGLCGQGLAFAQTPWALLPGLLFLLGAFSLPWIASLLTWLD